MTCCQETRVYHTQITMADSAKTSWCEDKRRGGTISCGMLPTLRALASRGCDCQGSICLVPFDMPMDAASHLQMTLLKAYCREIGIKVLSVSEKKIRDCLCPGSTDMSCVLIAKDDPLLLELPD
ncbi:uncharacterized protein LOC109851871 [Pseudomyrmex gracilis]|uniref:uncharacterized protein LOC109851871 n=1 Tax=Pseudomyrmex gracilis TaxID=219809 RepID=UPI0009950FE0|nr:uncharacterized protein LOC109851871 [Pseudomyrmex gracilis]